jgi:hypothetical protein
MEKKGKTLQKVKKVGLIYESMAKKMVAHAFVYGIDDDHDGLW